MAVSYHTMARWVGNRYLNLSCFWKGSDLETVWVGRKAMWQLVFVPMECWVGERHLADHAAGEDGSCWALICCVSHCGVTVKGYCHKSLDNWCSLTPVVVSRDL